MGPAGCGQYRRWGDCGQRCVYGRTAALVHGCILVSSTRFMLQVRCFGRNDDIHVNTKAYVVHCLQSHTPTHQKSLKIAENRLKSRKIARNRAKSHAILRTIRSRVGLLMELGRKRKDRVSSKEAAMCKVRVKILQSLPRSSLRQCSPQSR